jgi:hypothetical protein
VLPCARSPRRPPSRPGCRNLAARSSRAWSPAAGRARRPPEGRRRRHRERPAVGDRRATPHRDHARHEGADRRDPGPQRASRRSSWAASRAGSPPPR